MNENSKILEFLRTILVELRENIDLVKKLSKDIKGINERLSKLETEKEER